MSRRGINLLRKIAIPLKRDNSNPIAGFAKVMTITANTTLTQADSGKIIMCNPTATTLITLPSLEPGWHCTVILTEDATGLDAGMDQKVNIDMGSGANLANCGSILEADGAAGDHCVADDDFIACSAAASPGDRFDFFCDGNRWHILGVVKDATECAFAQGAG